MKTSEVKAFREKLLLEQQNICALCRTPITKNACLDHDHSSGKVRGVLHHGCNTFLGFLENGFRRKMNSITDERLFGILKNYYSYVNTLRNVDYPEKRNKKIK